MWQLMWILGLVPNIVWHVLLVASVLGIIIASIVKFIPFINQYRLPVQLASVALLLLSIFIEGGLVVEAKYQEKIKELEVAVADAEHQRDVANNSIRTKIVEKKIYIKENVDRWHDRIVEVEKLIDSECKVDPAAIEIINDAAKNRRPKDSK